MRAMTMPLIAVAGSVHVFEPFLKLAAGADTFGRKFGAHVDDVGAESAVYSEGLTGFNHVIEQVANEFVIHGWARNIRTPIGFVVLGGIGRTSHPPVRSGVAGVRNEGKKKELSRALHQRVSGVG